MTDSCNLEEKQATYTSAEPPALHEKTSQKQEAIKAEVAKLDVPSGISCDFKAQEMTYQSAPDLSSSRGGPPAAGR